MSEVSKRQFSDKVLIMGHGLIISERFELAEGVFIDPSCPHPDFDEVAQSCPNFGDYTAVVTGSRFANFALEIQSNEGPETLAVKAWNSLWNFHLLSLACATPCFSLYSVTLGESNFYRAANRNFFLRPLPSLANATTSDLEWARQNLVSFKHLISCPEFSSAMRCYGNAHYLLDIDTKIMLLWAGIEGLLSVDSELSRRIALYAALMFDGTSEEKATYFQEVKQAYGIRSRAVHGAKVGRDKLEQGYASASLILCRLLRKIVELGRVPSPSELDQLAASQTIR